MYAPFFGLSKEPFSIAPDPRFLFMSEMHREALAHLLYGLAGGGGFVLLTGAIGAGKTTVCRAFLEQIPANCQVAYIFNPQLTAHELLQTVCDEFGIVRVPSEAAAPTVKDLVDRLNAFLLRAHAQGRQGVLIIDEAQSLSAAVLEQLRLLTNLETAERKLLQIVLIGQPELRDMLARPDLEQLAQRVIARYHLAALSEAETLQYIQHRIAVAGPAAQLPFEPAALRRVHRLTGGVPRRINLLCGRAMLGAYAQGRARVDRATVEQAAREVFGGAALASLPYRAQVGALTAALAAGLVLAAGAWWWSSSRVTPLSAGRGEDAAAAVAPAASVAAPAWAPASLPEPTARMDAVGSSLPASGAAPTLARSTELLAHAYLEEPKAWRDLARQWQLVVGAGDPCRATATAGVHCFRSSSGLGLLRQLGRPALLVLGDGQRAPLYALLESLSNDHATVRVGEQVWRLSLADLATVWRGEFATFWRAPPGWREGEDGAGAAQTRAWVLAQLDQAGVGQSTAQPRARVWAFQLAQGLAPDGLAGPMTLMMLNRAAGVDEPRLGQER